MPTDRLLYLSPRDGLSKLYTIDIHRGLSHKISDTELTSYTISPHGDQLLFVDQVDEEVRIFVMYLHGGAARQLVDMRAISPTWSPDSQSVAFATVARLSLLPQIYRVNLDGTGLQALTQLPVGETPFSPSWSPDGKRILFHTVTAGNRPHTYYMDAEGGARQLVSYPDNFEIFAASPRWSPDNRYIGFVGQVVGSQIRNMRANLCLLELTSGEVRCLTDDVFSSFAWSPDSQYIAYVSSGWSGIFNIEILDIETGETQRILRYDEKTPLQVDNLDYLRWTPDGRALVYELSISGSRDYATQLYIINVDGTDERRLTDGISANYAASWWPDD